MKRLIELMVVVMMGLTGCGSRDDSGEVSTPAQAVNQLDRVFAGAPESFRKAAADASGALAEGDLGRAVESLGALRSSEGVTVDQGLVVHNTMVMLEATLIERSAAGDAEARRAYALLKQMKQK